MRIAHISDLHLNSIFRKTHIGKTKKLIKLALEKGFDHLVITGDISDNSEENDFIILRKILKSFDLLDSRITSIFIGNHDIFGGIQKAEEILTFHEKCEGVHYKEHVNNFISYFAETFDNCYHLSPKEFFPVAKRINNTLLIGLNSVAQYSKLSNPFGSNGEISASQFGELYELLKSADNDVKYKIVMIHHHFNKIKSEAKSTFGSI